MMTIKVCGMTELAWSCCKGRTFSLTCAAVCVDQSTLKTKIDREIDVSPLGA